jgi:hypothetical protein
MRVEIRLGRIPEGGGARGGVRHQRHLAEQHRHLREHVGRNALTRDRECGGRRGVGVDHRAAIPPPTIDPKMQI